MATSGRPSTSSQKPWGTCRPSSGREARMTARAAERPGADECALVPGRRIDDPAHELVSGGRAVALARRGPDDRPPPPSSCVLRWIVAQAPRERAWYRDWEGSVTFSQQAV